MDWMAAAVRDSFTAVGSRVLNFSQTFFWVLVILVVGLLVAGWAQKILERALKAIRLDDVAQTARITEILQKGDIKYSLSELLGVFLYWLVILATLLSALNVLGLTMAAELLQRVITYVPNVLAGVIALILGLFFGTLVSGIVQTAAANAGVGQAKGLGQIARVVVIIFAVVVALEKFFSSIIVQTTFTIVLAAVAFGLALAFGLGCKDIAGRYVGDFLDKIRRR